MHRGLLLVALSGCEVVFPLDQPGAVSDGGVDGAQVTCPSGYTDMSTGIYKVVTDAGVWRANELNCENDRNEMPAITGFTHLVVISTKTEYDRVALISNHQLTSIGFQDITSEGEFRWVTDEDAAAKFISRGALPGVVPWKAGEPNDSGGNEDCVEIDENGALNDYDCVFPVNYICECDSHPVVGTFP